MQKILMGSALIFRILKLLKFNTRTFASEGLLLKNNDYAKKKPPN